MARWTLTSVLRQHALSRGAPVNNERVALCEGNPADRYSRLAVILTGTAARTEPNAVTLRDIALEPAHGMPDQADPVGPRTYNLGPNRFLVPARPIDEWWQQNYMCARTAPCGPPNGNCDYPTDPAIRNWICPICGSHYHRTRGKWVPTKKPGRFCVLLLPVVLLAALMTGNIFVIVATSVLICAIIVALASTPVTSFLGKGTARSYRQPSDTF